MTEIIRNAIIKIQKEIAASREAYEVTEAWGGDAETLKNILAKHDLAQARINRINDWAARRPMR